MLLAAICEACRRPLTETVINLQLQEGELISAGSEFKVRQTRNPHLYSLCERCAAYVELSIRALMSNGGPPSGMDDAPPQRDRRAG